MNQNLKGNVLVTGASGFVGTNLVSALVQRGYSVTCLVRSTSDTRALRAAGVRLALGDILDPSAVRDAVRSVNTVYHVAGVIKAAHREDYFRVNQAGTRRILESVAESNPDLGRFVHISSLAAAGPTCGTRGLTEAEKANPISWYGESKLRSEEEALGFKKLFPVTIIRPSAVYGPRDKETLLIFKMIKMGCLFTPGRFARRFSLIHVSDLVNALVKAGEQQTRSGEIFFISRFESFSWDDVGRAIARELGKKYRRISFPRRLAVAAGIAGDLWSAATGRAATISSQKVRELLQPSWLCDSSKAKAALGFSPEINLEDGIRQTANWYRQNGWL
jgi:dihydroflavonol-4-reductase